MNISMNGRKITSFRCYDDNGNPHDSRVGSRAITHRDNIVGITDIYLSATHHGDHDEFWIVVKCADGSEIRYNPNRVDYFHLAEIA